MAATWILVADSSRATLYSADKPRSPLSEVESFDHPESRARAQDLTSDRQGRSGEAGGSMVYDVDPKRHEATVFAKTLSDRLRHGRVSGKFDRLYITAAPAFLGMLRDKMDGPTSQLVVDSMPKDLTHCDAAEVRRHLPEYL